MTETARLFIAIPIPATTISSLKDVCSHFTNIQILPGNKAHLTLKFLGETSTMLIPELRESLATVCVPSFTLELSGLGTFSSKHGLILWAGFNHSPSLIILHQSIEDTLFSHLGIIKDKRKFNPHITLSRLKNKRPDIAEKVKELTDLTFTGFYIGSFGLYQSELKSSGAVHTLLAGYPLKE
jgi:2'-5' RNA ligase